MALRNIHGPGIVAIAAMIVALAAAPAIASNRGETYTCRFAHAGTVLIDTREPGSSITLHGRRHPATGGAYFYQSDDGAVTVMFGPMMRWWELDGERATRCTHQANRR